MKLPESLRFFYLYPVACPDVNLSRVKTVSTGMVHLYVAWVDKNPSNGCKISLLRNGYNQFLLSETAGLERV